MKSIIGRSKNEETWKQVYEQNTYLHTLIWSKWRIGENDHKKIEGICSVYLISIEINNFFPKIFKALSVWSYDKCLKKYVVWTFANDFTIAWTNQYTKIYQYNYEIISTKREYKCFKQNGEMQCSKS